MYELSALLFLLFASASAVEIDRPTRREDMTRDYAIDRPMTREDMVREYAIDRPMSRDEKITIRRAERAMEGHKRHRGDMPLRSSGQKRKWQAV